MIIEYSDGQKFNLLFDREKHGYFLVEEHKKTPIQSVTKVIDACYPKNLHEWSVREGANKFKEILSEQGFIRNEKPEVEQVCEKIVGAYKDVSTQAAEIGSIVHDLIDKRLSRVDPVTHDADLDSEVEEENSHGDEVSSCMSAFFDWAKSRKVKFLVSEHMVYHHAENPIYRFAGTLDAVVSINNKIFIVDFKTSKKIYKHYHLQVAAYAAAFRKGKSINRMGYIEDSFSGALPVDGMILRLDKKTGKFQEKAFSLSNRNHFNIFKNCLEIKAWNSKRIMGVKYVD
jgi:ATP-dependent exoDNAse (exonuclease V) beta subunit